MSTWQFRDKALNSLQNILEISKENGFSIKDYTDESEKSSLYLMKLCEQLETKNQLLNQALLKQKSIETNNVNESIAKLSKIDLKCKLVINELKSKLETLLNSRESIAELLNKPDVAGSIKMDTKYQTQSRPASQFFKEVREDLLSFEQNVAKYLELIEFIDTKNSEKLNIYEREMNRYFGNLEKSIEILLNFHEHFNTKLD